MEASHSVGGVELTVTQETYTFSRALHLMRYGGKKMKPITWESECYIHVDSHGDLVRVGDGYSLLVQLAAPEIMGSWVEVK